MVLTTDEELLLALNRLNGKAAVGPQRISSAVIKGVFSFAPCQPILLALMNRCLYEAKIPSSWGECELFILFKGKGQRSDPDNYRGINLINDFCRLYERLFKSRLEKWAEHYDATGRCQFGYKKKTSTLDAVFTLNTVANLFVKRRLKPLFTLMIDLKKAFPSVNRMKVLESLLSLGVPLKLCEAIGSTFRNNCCRLRIDSSLSKPFRVNRGVQEGSILSPDLFNILYAKALNDCDIYELPSNARDIRDDRVYFLVFADDLSLFCSDLKLLEEKANELSKHLFPYGLAINVKKTKWIPFLPERFQLKNFTWTLVLNGEFVECVDRLRYLGFELDSFLSPDYQRDLVKTRLFKAAKATAALTRSLSLSNLSSLRIYFLSMVASQLYGMCFFSFDTRWFDQAAAMFLREHFRLPNSFPLACARALLRLNSIRVSLFESRVSLAQRVLGSPNSLGFDVLYWDRKLLLPLEFGWNFEFMSMFEHEQLDVTCDLGGDVSEVRGRVVLACYEAQRSALLTSALGSFWLQVSTREGLLPLGFVNAVKFLSIEEARVILLFVANLLRWSALTVPSRNCPLCFDSFYSTHIFNCQSASFVSSNFTDLFSFIERQDWMGMISLIFQVLNEWISNVDRAFRFCFIKTVRNFKV